MKRFLIPVLLLPAALASAGPAVRSGVPDAPPPAVGVESLAWLAGSWSCEALGGVAEETWLPPAGGQMVGVFRVVRPDGPAFYEIMSLLVVDDRLTLRLKHFDADLRGWEPQDETVDFPLVAQEGGAWYFDGMTIEKHADDRATIHVRAEGGGSGDVLSFPYARAGSR